MFEILLNIFKMKKKIFKALCITTASILIIVSCKKIIKNCSSESAILKNKIAKTWILYEVSNNKCTDTVTKNAWILEIARSGDCYSITNNVFGEQEAQIGKWDIVNDGKTLQINNYFLTTKPIFISTWYDILKLSENELCLESSFNDKEVFHFKNKKN